jgi:hypothetical protein
MAKVEKLITQPDGRVLPTMVEEDEAAPPRPPRKPARRKPTSQKHKK